MGKIKREIEEARANDAEYMFTKECMEKYNMVKQLQVLHDSFPRQKKEVVDDIQKEKEKLSKMDNFDDMEPVYKKIDELKKELASLPKTKKEVEDELLIAKMKIQQMVTDPKHDDPDELQAAFREVEALNDQL